ncbi:hypothetical protein DH2020_012157 [Rehmannia glutinosa]|uniref:ABC transporter domain-containing protein n=1 Tax=Rehmannia glutinosa TaxID=99300 RepID=A0ABR0XFC4_REHGL
MAQLIGPAEIESARLELGRSLRSSFRRGSSLRSNSALSSGRHNEFDDGTMAQWAQIDRLPTYNRLRASLFDENESGGNEGKKVVDVTKLGSHERHMFIEKLIRHIEHDNLKLLHKMRRRIDKVGVKLPTIEVRYENLRVEAKCQVVDGKPLPTLWNTLKSILLDLTRLPGLPSQDAHVNILKDVSGTLKPGRMTLLLGPPGCGKTTLLKALSGNLDKSLKVTGEISYNGYKLEEFIPQKTSAYIGQYDVHVPEMTVRETLDFSSHCLGIGSRAEIMAEAISVEGQKTSLQTDYILKIIGLDICADTLYGDQMRRGISGGQKKRLTTGEMLVGPTRALFMDEISNGLDSSTTYQIISCLQQVAHITDATILVSLLQPAPETFDLFDDIMLMGEGKIVYHGPRADVISRKDQEQYWHFTQQPYSYVSVDAFSRKFKESRHGTKLLEELSVPFDKSMSHKSAISFNKYSLPKWSLFKTCMSREYLLFKRNAFVYIFKSVQFLFIAIVCMTVFLRTQMGIDLIHANSYMGALFFTLVILLIDGIPELFFTVARLEVFHKQRDFYFYPAWAFAIPASILKIPLSLLQAVVWTSLTYYVIGYSPEAERFFQQMLLIFSVHLCTSSLFRFLASVFQSNVASSTAGSLALLFAMLFSGFMIPKPSMPGWLDWAFWVSPLSYGQIGFSVLEFLAPRWQKELPGNTTMGRQILENRGLDFGREYFWISIGALFGITLLLNVGFAVALTLSKPRRSRVIISSEKLSQLQGSEEPDNKAHTEEHSKLSAPITSAKSHAGRMVLPFEPLSLVFQDVQYYVETPPAMKERGFTEKRLQLLCGITGAFRPGVLTALMGVSGAGKTTLLDVLSGRKTTGTVEGEIKVGGYPKVQSTFARISGYCEQSDIHSPNITVEESVIFSAWLRLHSDIDAKTRYEFVKEVLETIELDEIKDALVGMPGVDGLSTEQRKRLTIAVELVANPSIIFMDEPTTGLDARSAAIVMRAVKNVADTGRTIVCTIHQPRRLDSIQNLPLEAALVLLEKSFVQFDAFDAYAFRIFPLRRPVLGSSEESVSKLHNQQSLFTLLGSMYSSALFCGINNASSILSYVSVERTVVYREQFAGMYNPWAYSAAQVVVEIPYILAQTIAFTAITYPMIGYAWSAYKLFWYFYTMFCTMLYFTYLGMMLIAITPSFAIASILQSSVYTLLNLFSGFLIPRPQIPKWWVWYYYLTPTSWSLNGMLNSQFGDVDREIVVFGEPKAISAFLSDYFGYEHNMLPVIAVILIMYPIVFASIFSLCIGKLNYQKR